MHACVCIKLKINYNITRFSIGLFWVGGFPSRGGFCGALPPGILSCITFKEWSKLLYSTLEHCPISLQTEYAFYVGKKRAQYLTIVYTPAVIVLHSRLEIFLGRILLLLLYNNALHTIMAYPGHPYLYFILIIESADSKCKYFCKHSTIICTYWYSSHRLRRLHFRFISFCLFLNKECTYMC